MPKFVALLRGINVGGGNKLAMVELRGICACLGWQNVRTYIASGNVVFDAEGEPEALAEGLKGRLPIDVPVLVLSAKDLADRLHDCPFEPVAGNLLHACFCVRNPDVNWNIIEFYRSTEEVDLKDRTFWIHTPDGFSKSKVAERLDKVISGTAWTARNLNTVQKLVDMTRE